MGLGKYSAIMRRSPTALNLLGAPLGISQIVYNENIWKWVIDSSEKDGVDAISRNFVFFELHRITGFGVIFQTSDLNVVA